MTTVEFTIHVPDTADQLLTLIDDGRRIELEAYVRNGWFKLGPRQSLGRRAGWLHQDHGRQHHQFTWDISNPHGHLERELTLHTTSGTHTAHIDGRTLPYLNPHDTLTINVATNVLP
jgi:hypothetical protein